MRQRAKTASVAHRYEARPPKVLLVSFVRFAIAPLMPTLAMFANHDSSARPAHERYSARPRSTARVEPRRAMRTASSSLFEIP